MMKALAIPKNKGTNRCGDGRPVTQGGPPDALPADGDKRVTAGRSWHGIRSDSSGTDKTPATRARRTPAASLKRTPILFACHERRTDDGLGCPLRRRNPRSSCVAACSGALWSVHSPEADSGVEAACSSNESYVYPSPRYLATAHTTAQRARSGDESEAADWSGECLTPTALSA